MIISNELVGVDITLNCSSRFGYNTMGFETSTVTKDHDDMNGYFGIMTHCPIPVLQYGDSFTWVKYGYIVLHPDMICELIPGQDTSYCNALMSFLHLMSRDLYHFNLLSLYMMILIPTSTI